MNVDQATDLVRESLILMLMLGGPILGVAILVGLVISILQAVTQIQEQTLTFVPKMVGMGVVAILLTPWLAQRLMDFAAASFAGTP